MACYVARLDGEAVGTVEATEGGGVVGLYNIATLPEYRRRGIGTALTVHPLREATRRGARAAVLQAAADGVGIYQRVGFRSFGTITEYKPPASWLPEA
jgi:ribosomal protein S18 acetylase RimI-like enzyme